MLEAQTSQFRLTDDGLIFYQPDRSNPLPGSAVGRIKKGAAVLAPEADVTDPQGADPAAVRDFLQAWLLAHIAEVLEPLIALGNADDLPDPVRDICARIKEAMGVVPREDIEALIAQLDPPMRQTLRAKQIRLGPLLVFIPVLNKPAAVRLRAALWSLWHDKTLPAQIPNDGAVSIRINPEDADTGFYQTIGYPVFGPRAIRIDMLDRVIEAVYNGAIEGKFRAEHKMAEWLGCSIEDLYAILEAMGHRRVEEPEQELKPEAEASPSPPAAEAAAEASSAGKPELAMFRLKKGKAFTKAGNAGKGLEKPKKPKPERKEFRKNKPRGEKKPERPRIISAAAKSRPEDSPFAILEQLKVRKDAPGSS